MVSKRVIFGAFLLLVSSNFLYFGAFLIKQLFSYPTRAHGIIVKYISYIKIIKEI